MNIPLFIVYGFVVVGALAFAWALFFAAVGVLSGMINGTFTLRGVGWWSFLVLLALIPIFIAAFFMSEFQATFPA